MPQLSVTRRTVLQVATASGGGLLLGALTAAPSRASEQTPQISWSVDDLGESSFFSTDWSLRGSSYFPRAISVTPADTLRKFVARWDSRLFEIEPLAQLDDEVKDAPTQVFVNGAESGVATVNVPAGTTLVLFRVKTKNLYPNENIRDVQPTSFTLSTLEQDELAAAEIPVDTRPASPWGVETSVSWLCVDGRVVPGVTEVLSVGPNPVPAGIAVALIYSSEGKAVTASASEAPGLRLSSTSTERGEGLSETIFTSSGELPAGQKIVLTNEAEKSNSSPDTFGAGTPSVAVRAESGSVDIRLTGLMAAYPVTASGAPVSSFAPAPTVLNVAIEKE